MDRALASQVSSEEPKGAVRNRISEVFNLLLLLGCGTAAVCLGHDRRPTCWRIQVWVVSGGSSLPLLSCEVFQRWILILWTEWRRCFPGPCLHPGDPHLFYSLAGSVDRERPLHYHQRLWGRRFAARPGGPLHSQWPGGHCLLPSDPR